MRIRQAQKLERNKEYNLAADLYYEIAIRKIKKQTPAEAIQYLIAAKRNFLSSKKHSRWVESHILLLLCEISSKINIKNVDSRIEEFLDNEILKFHKKRHYDYYFSYVFSKIITRFVEGISSVTFEFLKPSNEIYEGQYKMITEIMNGLQELPPERYHQLINDLLYQAIRGSRNLRRACHLLVTTEPKEDRIDLLIRDLMLQIDEIDIVVCLDHNDNIICQMANLAGISTIDELPFNQEKVLSYLDLIASALKEKLGLHDSLIFKGDFGTLMILAMDYGTMIVFIRYLHKFSFVLKNYENMENTSIKIDKELELRLSEEEKERLTIKSTTVVDTTMKKITKVLNYLEEAKKIVTATSSEKDDLFDF